MRIYHLHSDDAGALDGLEPSLIDLRETMNTLQHAVVERRLDSGRPRLLRRSRATALAATLGGGMRRNCIPRAAC